jgi:hypothetical protein
VLNKRGSIREDFAVKQTTKDTAMVLQAFRECVAKTVKQGSCETGVPKIRVNHFLQRKKKKPSVPRVFRLVNDKY